MSVDENKMIFKKYLKIKKIILIKFQAKIGIYLKKSKKKLNQINL